MSIGNGKLFIGFDYCDVYDQVMLRRCFKCSGFNHVSENCKGNTSCPRCSGEHFVKDCKVSDSELKCINCIKLKDKTKDTGIDINHAAWDSKCHVFKQNVTEFKSKIYVA